MKHFKSVVICIFLLIPSIACLAETIEQSEKDKSMEKIKLYLSSAFQYKGKHSYAHRIQMALKEATENRELPVKSTDVVLRNAEYYLHGLYATASGDLEHTAYTAGATIYVAVKYGAYAAKSMGIDWFERMLRTDPDKQMSAPGGIFWAYSGLCDGLKVDGAKEVAETNSMPISLFSCSMNTNPSISPLTAPEGFSIKRQ